MHYRLQSTVGYALHVAVTRLRAEVGRRLRPHEVTPEQFAVLATLWAGDGLSQAGLGERLLKDKGNVARILERLEAKGLVRRGGNPADRRATLVWLTPAGRAMEAVLVPEIDRVRARAYEGLGERELDALRAMLERIGENLT